MSSLLDIVLCHANARPAALALADARRGLEYAVLDQASAVLAARLATRGVGPGDRVAVVGPARVETVVAVVAAWRLGATAVLLDRLPAGGDAATALARVSVRAVLGADRAGPTPAGLPVVIDLDDAGSAAPAAPAEAPRATIRPDDPAVILFTSGSTGGPRALAISHAALLANAVITSSALRLTATDRGAVFVSLGARLGLGAVCAHLRVGGAAFLEPTLLGPAGVPLERLAEGDVSVLTCVPTQLRVLLGRGLLTRSTLPTLRTVRTGANLITAEDIAQLSSACPGVELVSTYGLSETGELTWARSAELAARGGVGRPLGDVDLAVVDPGGTPVPAGETGEIAVAGPRLMLGYLDAGALAGRFRTGDLGRLDPDGWLHLEGRAKDVLKVAGETLSPLTAERALLSVAGVTEAAVVGVPDPLLGEAVCAFVVTTANAAPTVASLHRALAAAILRAGTIRSLTIVPALPRLPSGKVDLQALRARAANPGLPAGPPAGTEPIPGPPAVTEPIPGPPAGTEPIPGPPAGTEPIPAEPPATREPGSARPARPPGKFELRCVRCGHLAGPGFVPRCPGCGGAVEMFARGTPRIRTDEANPIRRYFDFLPLDDLDGAVWLGAPEPTPCVRAHGLQAALGHPRIFVKDETVHPTRSTKDRMASLVYAFFRERGIRELVAASTGNSSTALARGAGLLGDFQVHLFAGAAFLGAMNWPDLPNVHLYVVEGASFVEASAIARVHAATAGSIVEGGFFNPARRAGLKLAFFEAVEQTGTPIDWYIQAVSSGMGVLGTHVGASELVRAGVIRRPPRLCCVQQASCAPMVAAWDEGVPEVAAHHVVPRPVGPARAILRGDPRATYPYLRQAVSESHGVFLAVDAEEIAAARALLQVSEGIDACPASACTAAALRRLVARKTIAPEETVLLNVTGGERPPGHPSRFSLLRAAGV